MNDQQPSRAAREIEHGRALSARDPESTWGWGTPAGRLRARRRAELIAVGAGLRPGAHALEIGCGTGLFTEMFAGTGAEITAVDISPDLLRFARERGLPESRVRFLEKSFTDCGSEGPFDAVIGSSILHHLQLPDALERIFRLLKPGGVLCFAEPNMLNPQIMLVKNIPALKRRMGESPDETAFFRWPLRRALLNAGFANPEIRPFDWLHPQIPERWIGAVKAVERTVLERTPLVREFAGSLLIRAARP